MTMVINFKFTNLLRVSNLLVLFLLIGCNSKDNDLQRQIAKIPIESTIVRFDQLFFDSSPDSLNQVKKDFPFLFTSDVPDQFWLDKKKDTLFQELNHQVNTVFTPSDLEKINEDLIRFFQHVKYYFPEQSARKEVITLITEVDMQTKAVYADSLVFISLDTYLGQEHKFYQGFAKYLRVDFNENKILPDLSKNFVQQNITPLRERTFISQIIFQGKILYAQQTLLPWVSKANLLGYTDMQLVWCKDNEEQMWRYFLDNDYLYSTDSKLNKRFVEPAPFSKFYLEIDDHAPGKVGAWLGWQIVDSYMKNNNVTLQELLDKSSDEIFQKSKYKPKK